MSFIQNYGLFWSRDKVNWGSRGKGNSGTLYGYHHDSKKRVDFRHQAGVYILYEGDNIASRRVVYTGQAGGKNDPLLVRLRHHLDDHLWNRWSMFSWFGVYKVGRANELIHTRIDKQFSSTHADVLDHLEGVLITLLEPALNKRGANWGGATQYFQALDNEESEVLKELRELRTLVETMRK